MATHDPLNHGVTISYADQFAANGTTLDAPRSFVTLAYPTSVTDADGYTSSSRYHYDFGAVTWKQTPLPNVIDNQPGPQQARSGEINQQARSGEIKGGQACDFAILATDDNDSRRAVECNLPYSLDEVVWMQ